MLTLEQIVAIQGVVIMFTIVALLWSMIRLPKHSDGVGNLVAKLATLEGENRRMRAAMDATHVTSMDIQLRYWRILRDYRFSQNANERHKRANRRLRELPEVKRALDTMAVARRKDYEGKQRRKALTGARTQHDKPILETIPNPRREDALEASPRNMA